jgi:hypothetical protein
MGRVTVVRNKDILKVSPRYEAHQAQLGSIKNRRRRRRKKKMDSHNTTREKNWKHSLLYLIFIISILHITNQTNFSRKLILGNETVRIKKNPELPLRFRSDGTFKILQVRSSSTYFNDIISIIQIVI